MDRDTPECLIAITRVSVFPGGLLRPVRFETPRLKTFSVSLFSSFLCRFHELMRELRKKVNIGAQIPFLI